MKYENGKYKKNNNFEKMIEDTIKEHGARFPSFPKDFYNQTKEEQLKQKCWKLTETLRRVLWGSRISQFIKVKFNSDECPPIKKYRSSPVGKFVRVRPCGEKYGNKTYLGIYIGDVALGISYHVDGEKTLCIEPSGHNPAMFVPELGEVIYGCGSWWSEIESPDDIKDITDSTINNQWYVQAIDSMFKNEKKDDSKL